MRGRVPRLLAVGLAACASYTPTRVVLPSSLPPVDVREAVVRGIVRQFLGVSTRDLEAGRFISQALPDPASTRYRYRAFVRILAGAGGPLVEVTVARERLSTDFERPGWRIVGFDRDREAALAEAIGSFAVREAPAGP